MEANMEKKSSHRLMKMDSQSGHQRKSRTSSMPFLASNMKRRKKLLARIRTQSLRSKITRTLVQFVWMIFRQDRW
jgi:hypothetical protein